MAPFDYSDARGSYMDRQQGPFLDTTDYQESKYHNLILNGRGFPVYESDDEENAAWAAALYVSKFPDDDYTLIVHEPKRGLNKII